MPYLLKLVKNYISTGGFILISLLLYLFSDKNDYVDSIIEQSLPDNGRILAFLTCLGFIFLYEISSKHKDLARKGHDEIKDKVCDLKCIVEIGRLVSDVNHAFTEFQNSGRSHITGEYYIKEILSLEDRRIQLKQNSYTQNKLEFLISKIKYK